MASGTLATGLKPESAMGRLTQVVEPGMTLQTKLSTFAPNQHHAVCGTVRIVARNTTLDLCSRMLVHVRTPLFDVTLYAGFRLSLHET
jgi:hypothetical protein